MSDHRSLPRISRRGRALGLVATGAAAALALTAVQLAGGGAPRAQAVGLTPYGGCDELVAHHRRELRAAATAWGVGGGFGGVVQFDSPATGGVASETQNLASTSGASRASGDSGGEAVGSGDTGTNVQEQGVDEPDIAKLADGRLVVLARNQVRVLDASGEPRLLGSVRLGRDAYGGELLIDGGRVLVVTPGYRASEPDEDNGATPSAATDLAYAPYGSDGEPVVRLTLVDVSGETPVVIERAEVDGSYVSARLVDGRVRLVTSSAPTVAAVMPHQSGRLAEARALAANRAAAEAVSAEDVLPSMTRTSATGDRLPPGRSLECTDVAHPDRARGVRTVAVTTLRPSDGLEVLDATAVVADGDLVYASSDRLYVATSRWGTLAPLADIAGTEAADDEAATEVHAFDTTADDVEFVGSGVVPGYLLNRWALSEHEGVLRAAATRQPPWEGRRTEDSESMVVKLVERDGRLVETGRVDGLGRTEQIQSVRYFGDLAAVVTFRQTDPLYLIDLSDAPRVLGELKVPGYSTYLHPIGGGLLLGLGYDATERGRMLGVQASVFDIGDPAHPRLVDRVRLAGLNASIPALDDSRAFTYDVQRRTVLMTMSAYGYRSGVDRGHVLAVRVGADGALTEPVRTPIGEDIWGGGRVLVDGGRYLATHDSGVATVDAATLAVISDLSFDQAARSGR